MVPGHIDREKIHNMKQVLIHTSDAGYGPLGRSVPPALIPLLNKPLAQHQIEQGYACGIRDMYLIASTGLNEVNAYYGDGSRFGVRLGVLIGSSNGDECRSLLKHRFLFDSRFVLVSGFRLGELKLKNTLRRHRESGNVVSLICSSDNEDIIAAIIEPEAEGLIEKLSGSLLEALLAEVSNETSRTGVIRTKSESVSGYGLKSIMEINRRLLRNPLSFTHNQYFEEGHGFFIGRGTFIHPSARINRPVMIGSYCQIMNGAEVGPNVVLGDNSLIAGKAHVSEALIMENSYIGKMTHIENCIVAQNLIFDPETEERTYISDAFLLGRLDRNVFGEMAENVFNRGIALGALVTLAPLGLASSLLSLKKYGKHIDEREVVGRGNAETVKDIEYLPRFKLVCFPGSDLPLPWWPRLVNVVRGDMTLVGPRPFTPERASRMSDEWQLGRFSSAPGLTGVASFSDDESEKDVAESLYVRKKSIRLDAKILLARLARPLIGKKLARKLVGI